MIFNLILLIFQNLFIKIIMKLWRITKKYSKIKNKKIVSKQKKLIKSMIKRRMNYIYCDNFLNMLKVFKKKNLWYYTL